jgi:creatinine amidohydrolase/Fe(II)-dependent formamide hydrolase-like protein
VYAANVSMAELTGSVGDPSKTTKEKGEKILAAVIERASEFVQDIMS